MDPQIVAGFLIVGSGLLSFASAAIWLVEPRFRNGWAMACFAPGALLMTVLFLFKTGGVY